MTTRYRVRWTPDAEADAAGIVDWFNDPINADKVITQFGRKADGLETFPERGRIVPELRKIGILAYHEVLHKSWRMIYRIQGRDVWIMAVVDGHRLLEELLFERLTRSTGPSSAG